MTLDELIETLTDFRDAREAAGLGDLEVKVAQQPSWPLSARLKTVTRIGDTLWIATSEDGEYAPREAWRGGYFEEDDFEEDED